MLTHLDRRFVARIPGDQVAAWPAAAFRLLTQHGILVAEPDASSIPRCVCEERHPNCVVRVDSSGGVYRGFCGVFGVEVGVNVEQTRWYRFVWQAWAGWVRRKNSLTGPDPALGVGTLYVGDGQVAGREFGLIVVAPGCERAGEAAVPEVARQSGRPQIALTLGSPLEDLRVGTAIPLSALSTDFATINGEVLERALGASAPRASRGDTVCLMHSSRSKGARELDQDEYVRESAPAARNEVDLFIDLVQGRVWRKGRPCLWILNESGKSTGRRLGMTAMRLLADYVRRPGTPMIPKATPTYRGAHAAPRTSAVQLTTVRRSVDAAGLLRLVNRSHMPGESTYAFEPDTATWCVLDRPAKR